MQHPPHSGRLLAIFGTPETQVGLLPGGGSLTRLPRQIPYCKAVVMQSKDAREGPRAFKQKRKPNFIGE
jgi:enoyl-CoA hydratase/carnithine racemase